MNRAKSKSRNGLPGRPSVRTPELEDKLCRYVERGMPFTLAASAADIGRSTFADWRREDQDFAARIESSIAKGVESRLHRIESASETDWRAAAWLLEHCQPEHFAKSRIQVEAVGQFDHAFVVPQETLNQIAEARAKHDRERINGVAPPVLLPESRNGHE